MADIPGFTHKALGWIGGYFSTKAREAPGIAARASDKGASEGDPKVAALSAAIALLPPGSSALSVATGRVSQQNLVSQYFTAGGLATEAAWVAGKVGAAGTSCALEAVGGAILSGTSIVLTAVADASLNPHINQSTIHAGKIEDSVHRLVANEALGQDPHFAAAAEGNPDLKRVAAALHAAHAASRGDDLTHRAKTLAALNTELGTLSGDALASLDAQGRTALRAMQPPASQAGGPYAALGIKPDAAKEKKREAECAAAIMTKALDDADKPPEKTESMKSFMQRTPACRVP